MEKINIIGNRYGELLVESEHSKDHNGHIKFLCKCSCGNTHIANGSHLRRGNIKHCGCKIKKGKDSPCFKGCEEISGNWWYNHIKRTSNKRKIKEITITPEYAYSIFVKQNKNCALTKLPIIISNTNKYNTASIDRIDNTKGYIENNIQWLHKDINMMKRIYNQDYFIQMCKLVAGGVCEVKF